MSSHSRAGLYGPLFNLQLQFPYYFVPQSSISAYGRDGDSIRISGSSALQVAEKPANRKVNLKSNSLPVKLPESRLFVHVPISGWPIPRISIANWPVNSGQSNSDKRQVDSVKKLLRNSMRNLVRFESVRIHRSVVVNVAYIEKLRRCVTCTEI